MIVGINMHIETKRPVHSTTSTHERAKMELLCVPMTSQVVTQVAIAPGTLLLWLRFAVFTPFSCATDIR